MLAASAFLHQQLLHHLARDVGQAEVAALKTVGQFLVIEAQQMQHGRVEIVDMHLVLGRIETELI